MAINLFSDYGGFYNSYRPNNIPYVDTKTVEAQDLLKKQEEEALPKALESTSKVSEVLVDNRSRVADLENISLTYNQGDDFSYIGSDLNIDNPDMEQAISDMHKDKLLQDYQFFVGSSEDLSKLLDSSDGLVLIK